jgi:Tfp pilus assembly protein PilO
MKGLSKRERLLIALAMVVAVVVTVMLLPPGAAGKGRSLAAERRKARQAEAELARVRSEVADLEARVDSRLVEGTPERLARQMIQASQTAAKTAGLTIDDLKPAPVEKEAGVERVPVQISVSAPFSRVVRFLYELQRERERFQVDQLQMSTAGAQADRLDIQLRLVTYVRGKEDGDGKS